MTVIIEGKLEFTFDDNWQVIKWDDDPAYRKGIGKLDETKAVDVIGLHHTNELYLIEIKDFRVDLTSNRDRIGEPLAVEVGQKVRDTVAGVIAALRRPDSDKWRAFVEALTDGERQIRVVLWMEDVPTTNRQVSRGKAKVKAASNAGIMLNALKQKLAWLTRRVMVASLEADLEQQGVKVRNLAGAGLPTEAED
jgi:hypothetical protein